MAAPSPVAAPPPLGSEQRLRELARSAAPLRRVVAALAGRLVASNSWGRLGYVRLGDYARERLGMSTRAAQASARLARELGERPLLREAVHRGDVSISKAEAVLHVATGDSEARWTELARNRDVSVRALRARAKGERAPPEPQPDEPWDSVDLFMMPSRREVLDEALVLARRVLGAQATRWQCLEAISRALPLNTPLCHQ